MMTIPSEANKKSYGALVVAGLLFLSFILGYLGGVLSLLTLPNKMLSDILTDRVKNLNIDVTRQEKIVLEESSAIIDVVDHIKPAVVSIATSRNVLDFFGRVVEEKGGGTGFIITADGLIVTNKHVVADKNATYTVFTSDGKNFKAEVVDRDPLNDLAILSIKASGLPTVNLGSSQDLKVGQWVIAIGNALGEFSNSVTVGVISAKDRKITATGGGGISEQLSGLLQTDAAVNPGNSGGPLVNLAGQVVGINTAVAGGAENIGFAIPIDTARKAIDSVIKTGEIKRPMLGIRYIPITRELMEANQLSVDFGVWVLRGAGRGEVAVIPGSPADKAGIQENDIIVEINGARIDENNSLIDRLSEHSPGDKVDIKLWRKGKELTVRVELGELQ